MGACGSRSVGAAGEFPDARVNVRTTFDVDAAESQRGGRAFIPPVSVTLKILVIGSSSVGKTSLVHRYVHQKFSQHYRATLGADFGTKRITCRWSSTDLNLPPELSHVTLQLWDTAGQERYRSLGTAFYRGADAVAVVFDVTNRKTFVELDDWVHDFVEKGGLRDHPRARPLPLFIVGNKVDCDPTLREVTEAEAREWTESLATVDFLSVLRGAEYIEASAKTGAGVARLFEGSAIRCLKNLAAGSHYETRGVDVEAARAQD